MKIFDLNVMMMMMLDTGTADMETLAHMCLTNRLALFVFIIKHYGTMVLFY